MNRILMLISLVFSGCGSSNGKQVDLSVYAGTYQVRETHWQDTGTQCSSPPTAIVENVVEIEIDRSQFEATFDIRWDSLYGEIETNGDFFAVGQAAIAQERFDWTGSFLDQNSFEGWMNHIQTACTRTFQLNGERKLP